MAGAGYKLFQTGDVLTAAQVNTYLNEQTVMVFASSAARTSALSSVLAEGMVSYLQDTNAVEVYDGSNWVSIGSSGDITGVTAGTGISGGGTSGTVTITNAMATEITAAGDIIVGTGSGTFDNLPIGTTGQVLTADTTVSPYKVKWAAAGGGAIKQIVFGSTTTSVTVNNSTTYVDTNLTATITPTSASSTILVMVTQGIKVQRNAAIADAKIRLMRNSTEAIAWNGEFVGMEAAASGVTYNRLSSRGNFDYVDSPATTSAVVYKTQGAMPSATSGREVVFNDGMQSSIVLMEIGA
jgi:hypothetical protein